MNAFFTAHITRAVKFGFASLFAVTLLCPGSALAARGGNGGGGGGGGKTEKTYSVGGTATGVSGAVTLQNDYTDGGDGSSGSDTVQLTADGSFAFPQKLPKESVYVVTVSFAPEDLSCTVSNGTGTISKRNVSDVLVYCESTTVTTYSVGGSVSGLSGTVVLQNNGSDDLSVSSDGAFTFATPLAEGSGYAVTVSVQPVGQSCSVANGEGTIGTGDVTDVEVSCANEPVAVNRLEGAGDSIMRGYNASCTGNTGFFDLFCYSGGDQNQHSFLDGSSSSVVSLLDRYLAQNGNFTGGKSASASGSEMTDPGKNNFATQAAAIVASATQPVTVVVELGGNDLCNRASPSEFYDAAAWQAAVDAGLQILVDGLPDGSSVFISGVPRVQDLRSVGISKQNNESGVDCESFWATFDVCTIATASDQYFDALQTQQQLYNQILADRAAAFNADAVTTGVEVVAEYQGETPDSSVGTYGFSPAEINGGDCFHPSIAGQTTLSQILWLNTPFK